jgi:hypothetical protein
VSRRVRVRVRLRVFLIYSIHFNERSTTNNNSCGKCAYTISTSKNKLLKNTKTRDKFYHLQQNAHLRQKKILHVSYMQINIIKSHNQKYHTRMTNRKCKPPVKDPPLLHTPIVTVSPPHRPILQVA